MEPSKYWMQPVERLLENLKSTTNGISSADVSQRLTQYGSNTLKVHRRNTPLLLFLNQFKSPIVLILIFATIMSALLGAWLDATIITMDTAHSIGS